METSIELVCIDLDGVVYRGDRPIEGASWFVHKLIEHNIKYAFVTNSTLRPRSFYAEKLNRMGIPANDEKIITAAYATYRYLKRREKNRSFTVFLLGEEGLRNELARLECRFQKETETLPADYVVVGLDRSITYEKLCKATRDLLAGARFIGVNNDALWPVEDGFMPGVGMFVAALRAASGKRPYIVGKPNTFMIKLAMEREKVPPERVLMVGDKLDSDILMGNRAKTQTALVLTGVTGREEAIRATGLLKPRYIARDLRHLWELINSPPSP